VHGTEVYSAGVGPNGPALERFSDIKKKKKIHDIGTIIHISFHISFNVHQILHNRIGISLHFMLNNHTYNTISCNNITKPSVQT
jgi:hypothetical protein